VSREHAHGKKTQTAKNQSEGSGRDTAAGLLNRAQHAAAFQSDPLRVRVGLVRHVSPTICAYVLPSYEIDRSGAHRHCNGTGL